MKTLINAISLRFAVSLISILLSCEAISQGSRTTVVLFVIDGLQSDAARAAMTHGASNLKFLFENGVWAEEAYCTSPSGRALLPDGSSPWGTASPPNVAMHTGTHLFESRDMDDLFLAARRVGIRSVFAGSAENYKVFSTADYVHAASNTDSIVIRFALDHFNNNNARLLSIHLQELRRGWTGPEDKLKADSPYQKAILVADGLLGRLIKALKDGGVWDSSYVIVSSDHGMGMTKRSDHSPATLSSWQSYLNFYGPGIKKGATIPYAETPDIAIMIAHCLRLPPLQGHTDPGVRMARKGTTGVLLSNIFEGGGGVIDHPKYIRRYLESKSWSPADDYAEYRAAMLKYLSKE
ncbi:MAG TPA: alkaline phosphatase family protein [Bacteroidota bacterium]|nr:alkaline phosphatase family protein [Bacteroidota bacterium]